ncbi:MAPEG family protein, partial [Opisthorchis viverrini]
GRIRKLAYRISVTELLTNEGSTFGALCACPVELSADSTSSRLKMTLSRVLAPPLSSLPICIPRYYGGVVLVGAGSLALNAYFTMRVMKARKEHNVQVSTPQTANCSLVPNALPPHEQSVQLHSTLEMLPSFLMTLFIGGLRYPRSFAVCGVVYLLGRILYFRGYSTGDPEKRKLGGVSLLGLLPMFLGLVAFGAQHLMASLNSSVWVIKVVT